MASGPAGVSVRRVSLCSRSDREICRYEREVHLCRGCDLLTDDSSKFAEAIATARRADIVLAAMGEDFNWSGEAACRTDLKLPGAQQALLKELKKTGKPLGLILVNGRPLDLSWEDQHVDGILEAWYLGTMAGHGMADVISGDYNPSARDDVFPSYGRSIASVLQSETDRPPGSSGSSGYGL